jgi:hypothetical protein
MQPQQTHNGELPGKPVLLTAGRIFEGCARLVA